MMYSRPLLTLAVSLALLLPTHATPPFWWRQGNPPVLVPSATPENKAAANIGQAKWMAKSALEALRKVKPALATQVEAALVGSNKPIASWTAPAPGTPDALAQRAPLLIGHLKSIAEPFYAVLHTAEPAWLERQLVANQTKDPADSSNYFPWTSSPSDDNNHAAVALGQLKAVFSLKFSEMATPRAVRTGFDGIDFARNDDKSYPSGSGTPVSIGFPVNFYGETFSQCYVNNNGNITFGKSLSTYTPQPFGATYNTKIIAPFWADVDTELDANQEGGEIVRFTAGGETVNGYPAFGVTSRDVGYYKTRHEKRNIFQLILIDRPDPEPEGDFDIEFNYDQVLWETGQARSSGGTNGYGGNSVRVGLGSTETNEQGAIVSTNYLEYQNSGVHDALLDYHHLTLAPNTSTGLIYQTYNNTQPGRILIRFRDGFPQGAHNLIVNAGEDVTLPETQGASFQLQGSVSPPPYQDVSWTFVSGPATAVIASPTSLTTNVTISRPGDYVFRLSAKKTGVFSESVSDTVKITHPGVFDVDGGIYTRAHPDSKTLVLDQAVATFSGIPASVVWTKIGGPAATIANSTALHPTVTLTDYGIYRFRMTVTSNTSPSFVTTGEASVSYHYQVSAGNDLTLPENSGRVFTLNGSAPSGTGFTYEWYQVRGPGYAEISNPNSLSTQVTIDQLGEYEFELAVYGPQITTYDRVIVTHPATFDVSAGNYYLPESDEFTLDQAFATFSGGPVTVHWSQIYGVEAEIDDPTALQPSVTLPGPGYYQFEITATTGHSPPFVKTEWVSVYYSE